MSDSTKAVFISYASQEGDPMESGRSMFAQWHLAALPRTPNALTPPLAPQQPEEQRVALLTKSGTRLRRVSG